MPSIASRQHVGRLAALRVAEVEAVRDRGRLGARAGDVQRGLGDRRRAAASRVEPGAARRCRRGRPRWRGRDGVSRTTAGVAARAQHRARADELVVLARRPTPWSRRWARPSSAQQHAPRSAGGCRHAAGASGSSRSRSGRTGRERVARAVVHERRRRAGRRRPRRRQRQTSRSPSTTRPIDGVRELPARRRRPAPRPGAPGATTASMRSCDSESMTSKGSMSASRRGTRSRSSSSPTPAARRHLGRRGGEARRAEVLQRGQQVALHELERALDQPLAGERVADLHAGPLLGVALVDVLRGQHAGAADAVAPGARAEQHHDVARARRRARVCSRSARQDADAHRVDEAVLLVARLEDDLAADVGDAHAVAVARRCRAPRRRAGAGRARSSSVAEAQRVEDRDRPRAHREDVAQDAADAGGGALEGLDRGRVVVALDLEGEREAVADVDHAGVLARALQHARAPSVGRRRRSRRGVLVAAVLGPEQREDRELEVVRAAARWPRRSASSSPSVRPRRRWSGTSGSARSATPGLDRSEARDSALRCPRDSRAHLRESSRDTARPTPCAPPAHGHRRHHPHRPGDAARSAARLHPRAASATRGSPRCASRSPRGPTRSSCCRRSRRATARRSCVSATAAAPT